jgi:hypothetical protein
MVPLDSAQRLYEAANEPRQLWLENDVPHLNMYAYYKTRYAKRVIKFFDEYLLDIIRNKEFGHNCKGVFL